jgi:mono/diheme cytochrome c family protein
MRRYLSLFIVVLSVLTLFACGNSDSANQDATNQGTADTTANTNATITGSAIKGPIDSAEMKLFYFSDDGTETEIVAENAPVRTASSGAFEFQVDPEDLENIQGPLVMKSTGGSMGGQPAPELKTIISDPNALRVAGQAISQHLSTASSVAAEMLENRVLRAKLPPQATDAEACIAKVEEALEIDLQQDPADVTQAVAMVNLNVDENLDLFNTPQNNAAVKEYIEYLAHNINSDSGMLDDKMEDPHHPGEDMDADFHEFGDGHLGRVFPKGPSRLLNLMVKVDKKTILNDGTDAATIYLKLTNGWGRHTEDEPRIDLAIISGLGQLSDTYPLVHHGRARVTLTSTTPGDVMIQASYPLENGNTISQEVVVQVVDSMENAAPVANAGIDRNVSTGALVALDGSQSSDVNNDPLTYSWVLATPGGSSATLSDPTIFNPTFTADMDGTYIAELVVGDGTMDSAPSSVTIVAVSGNSAPTANAGSDQNVTTGSIVVLDGGGSQDADNDPLAYIWTMVSRPAGSSAGLSNDTQSNPSFTADAEGTYIIELVVNDGTTDSSPDTVTINATAAGPDGAALFSANCAVCHGADGTQIVNLRGISASAIESKMPHKGNTLDGIGGSAGAQAIAGFLGQ